MSTTIELAGRSYPSATVICPPHEDEDTPDVQRSLGCGQNDASYYIPAENGLLFEVAWNDNPRVMAWSLYLCSPACELHYHGDEAPIYLPRDVYLVDGELLTGHGRWDPGSAYPVKGLHCWFNAEADWIAETIDRLSGKPYTIPDGPRVKLIPRNDHLIEQAS